MSSITRRATICAVLMILLTAGLTVGAHAATKPAAPKGLAAVSTQTTATLSWSKAKNATKYRACLQEFKGQSPCLKLGAKTAGTTTSFTGLTPGRKYVFKIFSYRTSHRAESVPKGFYTKPELPPAAPANVVGEVGSSTIVVTWDAAKGADDYSVCLMTSSADERCHRTSPRSTTRSANFAGLATTPGADYFYRVYSYNGAGSARSDKKRADLPVAGLASVAVPKVRSAAFRLTWDATPNAETYRVDVATNAAMTAELKTYTVPAGTTQFSPTGLTPGARYYSRVRGENGVALGPYSAVFNTPLPTDPFDVTVITYNLCGQDHCRGSASARARIKPWSQRKAIAGDIARDSGADLIATQESHNKETALISELPGFGSGAYYSSKTIFYKKAVYRILDGNKITLDGARGRYATWNKFLHKPTNTPFYFVNPHLEPGKGKSKDDIRTKQTRALISAIDRVNTGNLPVIYAGDYNSNKSNAQKKYPGGYDAPLKVFTEAGILDTVSIADNVVRSAYNSANQALNPPLKNYDHVDHIFVSPDIRALMWGIVIKLDGSNYETPFATDHNPVKTRLAIPGLPGMVG